MTQSEFTIRSAGADDVPALARLMELSYRHGFADILPDDALNERNESYFVARFTEQWPSIHLAESAEGACIGLIQVRNGHLDLIFIHPGRAGSALATSLLRKADVCGAKTLECFRDNVRARRFYEREGWVLSGAYEREFAGAIYPFVTYRKMVAAEN